MIVVFDAYKRDEAMHKKKYDGIDVIYTSYQMTADAYIEKMPELKNLELFLP